MQAPGPNAFLVSHDVTNALCLPTAGIFNLVKDADKDRGLRKFTVGDWEVDALGFDEWMKAKTLELTDPPQAGLNGNFASKEWLRDVVEYYRTNHNYISPVSDDKIGMVTMWHLLQEQLKRQTLAAIEEDEDLSRMSSKLNKIITTLENVNITREQESNDFQNALPEQKKLKACNLKAANSHKHIREKISEATQCAKGLAVQLEDLMTERVVRRMLDEILTNVMKDTREGAAQGPRAVTMQEPFPERAAQGARADPMLHTRRRTLQPLEIPPKPVLFVTPVQNAHDSRFPVPRRSHSPRFAWNPGQRSPMHSPSAGITPKSAAGTPRAI